MVAHVQIKDIDPGRLFLDRVPPKTRKAFLYCIKIPLFTEGQWYLAGGTALALQTGHRQSLDLDFFSPRQKFAEIAVERELLATKQWQTDFRERGTIYGALMGAKMSFIAYPFFKPSVEQLQCGTVRMLVPKDIVAMKIIAISQRGRKRDFVDLYWYCNNRESLSEVIGRALSQYPQEHNIPHLIKSLVYFRDAEDDPMPRLFFDVTWKEIKSYFQREVLKVAKEFLLRS